MKVRRRRTVIAFTVALVVVGAALLTNVVPYKQIVDQQREVTAAVAELEAIRQENAMLTTQRDALQTPVEIERLAREKLGYVRPGEVAFVVLEPPTAPTTTVPVVVEVAAEDQSLLETMWNFVTGADLSG